MNYIVANRSLTIIVLAGLLFFASCGQEQEHKKKDESSAPKIYKTMQLQMRAIGSNVQLPGVLEPFEFVQIYPKVNGFVKTVLVDRGSVVKKGQILLTLEAPEIEQQVAAAKLKYTQAEAIYVTSRDRYHRLLETSKTPGTVAAYDLDAAESKMRGDSATAQGEYSNFKAQETIKSYLTVAATFDGVITERNVHPGALAGPGSQNAKPMLVLQQQSKLRLVVNIPEQYSAQVNDGDKVHFKVNALPGQDFKGTVSRSSQSLSNNYRTETIEIDVQNPDNVFKPGMYAEVTLPTSGNTNAYVVPKSAVVTTTERRYVIAKQNGAAHLVNVTQGNEHADSTEVFGNLQNGDVIVTNGSYQIKEGDKL